MSYKSDIEFIINELQALNFNIDFSDVIKTKAEFNYIIDNLQRDNFISEKTANNIYLSIDKMFKRVYILCGSYAVNLKKQ